MPQPLSELSRDSIYLQAKARLNEFLHEHIKTGNSWWIGSAPTQRKTIFSELGMNPRSVASRFVQCPQPVLIPEIIHEWPKMDLEFFGAQMNEGLNLIYIVQKQQEDRMIISSRQQNRMLQYLHQAPLSLHENWKIGVCEQLEDHQALWKAIHTKKHPWFCRQFRSNQEAVQIARYLSRSYPGSSIQRKPALKGQLVFAYRTGSS